jgi:hypothetical protein
MPEKEPGKSAHSSRPVPSSASSEDYPVNSSYKGHPGDFGYIELVSDIQNRLGRLSEAVETLKTDTASHGSKLSDIAQDIHTEKVTLRIAGTILAVLLAFACWVGNKAVDAFIHNRQESSPRESS